MNVPPKLVVSVSGDLRHKFSSIIIVNTNIWFPILDVYWTQGPTLPAYRKHSIDLSLSAPSWWWVSPEISSTNFQVLSLWILKRIFHNFRYLFNTFYPTGTNISSILQTSLTWACQLPCVISELMVSFSRDLQHNLSSVIIVNTNIWFPVSNIYSTPFVLQQDSGIW